MLYICNSPVPKQSQLNLLFVGMQLCQYTTCHIHEFIVVMACQWLTAEPTPLP